MCLQGACLSEAIAIAQIGRVVEYIAARYVLGMVDQVDGLVHLRYHRHADIEVALFGYVAVAESDVLIHIVVAESVRQIGVEHEFIRNHGVALPSVGELYGVVVGKPVGVVPAVAETIGECKVVTFCRIAEGLGRKNKFA